MDQFSQNQINNYSKITNYKNIKRPKGRHGSLVYVFVQKRFFLISNGNPVEEDEAPSLKKKNVFHSLAFGQSKVEQLKFFILKFDREILEYDLIIVNW